MSDYILEMENIKELESLIKNNRKKAEEILSIGTTYEVDNNTVKSVTKEEATKLGKLYKEISEATKRINELMKGV